MKQNTVVHREVLHIAFPMLLTGISTPLLGMVDTAVVGHLPHPHFLAAIALGSMMFTMLFWAMGFLRMGTTGLTARALGAQDEVEKRIILYRGLVLAFVLGIFLILFQLPIKAFIFYFIDTTPEVTLHAQTYFDIRIWTAPATLATYVLLGWYLGLQKPGFNLLIVVSINLINIVLDIIFVVYLDLNSAGVAWATLTAEYAGLVIAFYCVNRAVRKKGTVDWHLVFQLDALKKYLVLNFNVFIRTLFLLFSFSFFTLQSAKYGPIVLAANAILMNFQAFMAYALDSLAHAAEVLVGKYYNNSSKQTLYLVLKITGFWSAGIAIMFALVYWVSGNFIISLLTNIDEVINVAMTYLPWLIISPLISVWSYWFDGIFIGAGYSRAMRDTMLFSFSIFMLTWFLLSPWGNHGLWAALISLMLARSISMAFVAKKKLKGLAV
jgi:MATE family multidrug resistance protein